MIKFYGTDLCPDCIEVKEYLKNIGLKYEYIDITKSILSLKEFLIFRDTNKEFEPYREKGFVCVPALLMEDGSFKLEDEIYKLK